MKQTPAVPLKSSIGVNSSYERPHIYTLTAANTRGRPLGLRVLRPARPGEDGKTLLPKGEGRRGTGLLPPRVCGTVLTLQHLEKAILWLLNGSYKSSKLGTMLNWQQPLENQKKM